MLNDMSKHYIGELSACNFSKTILMVLVIFCHAIDFWTGTWFTCNPVFESEGLCLLAEYVGGFHIYGFALISGYIFAYKVMSGEYSHYLSFLQNKAKRLLVPYVFVVLIWVAPISEYFFRKDFMYMIKTYILCINPSQLWFLWMLFGVFAIVWPIRRVVFEKPIAGWTIAIVFYCIGTIGGNFIPNVFCIWTACQYVLFFFMGMRIMAKGEKREQRIIDIIPWYCWLVIDLILFAGKTFVERQNGLMWNVMLIGLKLLLHIVGAIMAWMILQRLSCRIRWQDSKVFNKLSSYSMSMYLFHQQIIYFSIQALNGVVNPWFNAVINFIVAIVISWAISALLMKWRVTRFLIGEKI